MTTAPGDVDLGPNVVVFDPSMPSATIQSRLNQIVRFQNMVTVSLGGTGTIRHVVNDRGGPSNSAANVADLVNYP